MGQSRPVSRTSILSKIMEWLIQDSNNKVWEGNVINGNQHGFMKSKFCQANLMFLSVTLQVWLGKAPTLTYYIQNPVRRLPWSCTAL